MDGTNEGVATGATGAVGDAVIVGAAPAGWGSRRRGIDKTNLRSQNLLLALDAVPLLVGPPLAAGIGSAKRIVWASHGNSL